MSRRPGRLYLYGVYDPHALLHTDMWGRPAPLLKVIHGYYGQTRRKAETRWREHEFGIPSQHKPPQVWADTVVWRKVTKEYRWIGDHRLDAKEAFGIMLRYRPVYNISLNMANPRRIPPWEAAELRARRDALGGTAVLVELAKQQKRQSHWWRTERLEGGIRLHPHPEGELWATEPGGRVATRYGPLFED